MATIGRFEEIEAWKKGRELRRSIYALSRDGKFRADFGLKVVVARLNEGGGVFLKKFQRTGERGKIVKLISENAENYSELEFPEDAFRFIYPAIELKQKLRR